VPGIFINHIDGNNNISVHRGLQFFSSDLLETTVRSKFL
jgi:hypothetical protein